MTSLPAWLEKHVFFQTNQAIFLFTVLVELYSSMRRNLYIILAIAFLIAVAPLTIVLIRSIVIPLTSLTLVADKFSRGRLDLGFPELDRKDEVGKLANALERLGTSMKMAMRKMAQMRQSSKLEN